MIQEKTRCDAQGGKNAISSNDDTIRARGAGQVLTDSTIRARGAGQALPKVLSVHGRRPRTTDSTIRARGAGQVLRIVLSVNGEPEKYDG